MRLVDLDTKVTTWRYNFDKEEYVAVQTTVGEMIDLNTLEGLSVPIIEIKEPHGRLGNLDNLEEGLRHMAKYQCGERQQGILGCCETIRSAPAIIPASKEGM